MGKMELFSAFANGRQITLPDVGNGLYLTGIITQIALESGFSAGQSPHNFIVTLVVEGCKLPRWIGTSREIYVKTVD